jgi:hypothetical protein
MQEIDQQHSHVARQLAQRGLQNPAGLGQHQGGVPFQDCGVNEIQVSLINSTSVGATPTPATNLNDLPAGPASKVAGPAPAKQVPGSC